MVGTPQPKKSHRELWICLGIAAAAVLFGSALPKSATPVSAPTVPAANVETTTSSRMNAQAAADLIRLATAARVSTTVPGR
jgi:hypothetical protein